MAQHTTGSEALVPKLLLTSTEARYLTSLGRTKWQEIISSGELRVVRVGRAVRIPSDELRRWIESKSATA